MSNRRDFLSRTEQHPGAGREAFSHLETFGRLMAGVDLHGTSSPSLAKDPP